MCSPGVNEGQVYFSKHIIAKKGVNVKLDLYKLTPFAVARGPPASPKKISIYNSNRASLRLKAHPITSPKTSRLKAGLAWNPNQPKGGLIGEKKWPT